MKTIRKLIAALLCAAAVGSAAVAPAFATEGDTTESSTTTPITIDAKAVACGYTSDLEKNLYDAEDDKIRLGGAYTGNPAGTLGSKYSVPTGADQIIYNQTDDVSSKDTRVSYLKFSLPDDVTTTDTYTLTMTACGLGHTSRPGAMDIYAGIAKMDAPVVSTETAPGPNWTTITWKTRPVVSGVKQVATEVDITVNNSVSLDLTEVLQGQKAGTVTVVLMSKASNTETASDSYFNNVKLTRTEPAYQTAAKVEVSADTGVTKDAAGFTYSLESGVTSVTAMTWQITYDNTTRTLAGEIPTISSDGNGTGVTIGLLITDIPSDKDVSKISAKAYVK